MVADLQAKADEAAENFDTISQTVVTLIQSKAKAEVKLIELSYSAA